MKDLEDLKFHRKPLSKTAYIARVKAIMSSKKSQEVAQAFARKFRSTCKEVAEKLDGAAASN